jgi:hypothetical protein
VRSIDAYDIAVDFMDMTDDRHLWVRPVDVRAGIEVTIGRHLVVGDDGADPQVARIVALDADGNIKLEVLPGSVESHTDLLARPDHRAQPRPLGGLDVPDYWMSDDFDEPLDDFDLS